MKIITGAAVHHQQMMAQQQQHQQYLLHQQQSYSNNNSHHVQQQQHGSPLRTSSSGVMPASAAAAAPHSSSSGFSVRAIYDYSANDDDEVSFLDGDLIVDCVPIDEGWITGTVHRTRQRGMLPGNYVEPCQWIWWRNKHDQQMDKTLRIDDEERNECPGHVMTRFDDFFYDQF